MIGKSVCPSCQKQRERLEYYCMSEIYRGITLLSASTVGSIYNGFYIVFYRVALRHATRVRGRHGSSGAVPRVLPGDEPARVEEFRRTSALCVDVDAPYERIRPASKVKILYMYVLSVCLCQIFAHQFNLTLVTFTCQHGGYKLYYGKLRCRFKWLLSAYWISYRIKMIFNEQRLSYINIRLTNVKFNVGQ